MDRGTRARSVGGWEVVCAPGSVFESNVSSETVDGVTTTIVSSVSSTTDPWSDIVDATFYDAVDNMSVRTVITTTDGQYRPPQGTERIYVQDKVVVSPTRAAFRIRKPQEQPSVSDKCVPAPYRSNGISNKNNGQVSSDPCSIQDKCTATPVRPTRLKEARSKQTPSPVLSPTGTTKPAVPAKPPHLVRGPLDPPYRPHYEEYMAEGTAPQEGVLEEACSPPRVSRLLGLLSRDEERRKKGAQSIEGENTEEWDSILSGVLASVSELEKVAKDVGGGEADEEDAAEEKDQSTAMDEEAQTVPKEETPTKIKSLRFKLDPDIFDVPSDDSFYDDDVEDEGNMRGWRTRYKGGDEPVRLVSVQASVVPAGQKMTVARPVGIDLRVRLTTEGGKRAHTSPLQQAKRRSPVSDRGWCQELSPVTENVDWRDTFTPNGNSTPGEVTKPVPNGILKTPSPKSEGIAKDSVNPFKEEAKTNGVHEDEKQPKQQQQTPPKPNGMTPWNPPQRKFSLPRKKFEPDPEAVDRITGYKTALSKPPLPPPIFLKVNTPPTTRNRAEIARKQYLMDNKAVLSASPKPDGSRKFQQFLAQAQSDRERLVTSVPDLAAIEKAVHEKWAREKASRASPAREDDQNRVPDTPSSRGSTPDDAWSSYVQTCRKHLGRRSQSMSYLETDVDLPPVDEDKWSSTTALDHPDSDHPTTVDDSSDFAESQEDLNDSGRAKSEHELRIQRSLQSLPLPDWYKKSDKPKTGFLLKSSERKEKRGWAAAKSLASSTSSLASCGVKRPVHSLRSSRENIPWSRSSPSPDGPALSLALSRAFREPYMGWRARTSTTSSGVSSSPNSSWCGGRSTTTDEEAAIHGISFDGEDVKTTSSGEGGCRDEPPSADDTGADAATVSMDTGDLAKLPGGEDTCDDINNMSMDTCELFDAGIGMDELPSIVLAPGGENSPQADTGDDIDNLSTDTTTDSKRKDTPWKDTTTDSLSKVNGGTVDSYSRRNKDTDSISQSGKCPSTGNVSDSVYSRSNGSSKDSKSKRYSYSRSIYHSEWGEEESRGDRKGRAHKDPSPTSPDSKVIWIESSFVGSRTTTSIVVLPQGRESKVEGDCVERPASR